ncbi:hypothetical protein J4458_06555 [Candidatus Woesearchaeota archaeon]|nr:hypothetical protein [Candidatus Woesearchaeota archaeon]
MVSAFRGVVDFFGEIGLFDVVLPFLLVFTVVFAILEKTKVFGIEEIEGKKYTRKNLNSIAAFVIAFLVIASARLVEIVTTVSANMVVLLLLVVLFLLLVGSFYAEGEKSVFLEGGWKTLFMAIVFIGIILIFLDALGFLEDTLDFLKGGRNEVVGAIILLVVIVIFVGWIVKEPHAKEKK